MRDLNRIFLFEYRREIRCPREEVFEAKEKKKKKTTARLPVVGSRWRAVLIITISIG